MRVWIRPARTRPRDFGVVGRMLPDDEVQRALEAMRGWPEHRPTSLRRLDGAARRAGVAEVIYKDESTRFGAGSFKAAGSAYAVQRALEVAAAEGSRAPTLCCATDGNHGRAVAWAARRAGCHAVIYLPQHALPERERRIRELGARVVRIDGTYDVAVERVRADAARQGWIVVSDTSDRADDAGVLRVMAGYALIVEEIMEALDGERAPTHAFLQAGVGTMAAAVAAQLARRLGDAAPRIVTVEPAAAACVLLSLETGRDSSADGALDTRMDCLAAGRVSASAWPILREWTDAAIAIDDDACVRALGDATSGAFGPLLDVGPSGIAGVAGLLALEEEDAVRAALSLDASSRVLVIGTEEAMPTDPAG